jgi:predicted histidine transporter YuiF (NhaC family)
VTPSDLTDIRAKLELLETAWPMVTGVLGVAWAVLVALYRHLRRKTAAAVREANAVAAAANASAHAAANQVAELRATVTTLAAQVQQSNQKTDVKVEVNFGELLGQVVRHVAGSVTTPQQAEALLAAMKSAQPQAFGLLPDVTAPTPTEQQALPGPPPTQAPPQPGGPQPPQAPSGPPQQTDE